MSDCPAWAARMTTYRGEQRVYEYHGWIHVRATAEATDDSDEKLPEMVEAIRRVINETSISHPYLFELRYINGTPFVHVSGFPNHRDPRIRPLFQQIGAIAPGSYGLLHILDDEDPRYGNEARVLRLVRGQVTESTEALLSPCVPTLEDPEPPTP